MTRPNILVILTDDQGWGDLSVHGNTNLNTPNVDSLARDGALFDRFYVCPVCAPTRAEFLTGRYHLRGGVHGVSTGAERLNLDETTIADVFKAADTPRVLMASGTMARNIPITPMRGDLTSFLGSVPGTGDNISMPNSNTMANSRAERDTYPMSVQTARWILWRQMSNAINRSSVISPTISHTRHFRYPTSFTIHSAINRLRCGRPIPTRKK